MIVNRERLLKAAPIKNMIPTKEKFEGASWGMSEAGYDIRLKQHIEFDNRQGRNLVFVFNRDDPNDGYTITHGTFCLGSTIEEFQMPNNLVGIVHDKSTWARHGLSVFNTVIEPGWCGFLTLEFAYNGNNKLVLPAGVGIAQVIFHQTTDTAAYDGKYQNAADKPQEAIHV